MPYDDYPDIDGNFFIRNNRYGNEYAANSEADYSWVYFALDAYNYQYVVKNTKTGKIDPSYVSGSFWQTENQYQALFYYRPWGQRYDVLMGYGTGNSRR